MLKEKFSIMGLDVIMNETRKIINGYKKTQKEIIQNKINHSFTDITKEFCLLYGEVGETHEAYWKKK